jgi:imidazolonepropionase-like amidohydrolase
VPLLLIAGGALFDGTHDPIEGGAVLVDGDRIVAAGPSRAVPCPEDARTIDLGDAAILPGLIDAHVHFQGHRPGDPDWPDTPLLAMRAIADAAAVLRSGFTTVRDCGSAYGIALRTAIEDGDALGPRVLAAGPVLSQTGGHGDWHELPHELLQHLEAERLVVDGVEACRAAVRRVVRAGADLVKVCTTGGVGSRRDHMLDEHFTVPEIEAIVDEAHRLGRRVAAHAQGSRGVHNAVRAGVDSIEHGYFLDDEGIRAMLDHGTALVPTFGLIRSFRSSLADAGDLPAWRVEKQRQCIEAMERSFPAAVAAGIPIATGSDTYGIRGRELGTGATELVAMAVDGHVPALEVLRFATAGGARVLGLEGVAGTLAAGASADVLAVRGRPWQSIEAVRHVAFVMARGRVVVGP